jgi:hypothetical protein
MNRRDKYTYSNNRPEPWRWILLPVVLLLLGWILYDINLQAVTGQHISHLETHLIVKLCVAAALLLGVVRR